MKNLCKLLIIEKTSPYYLLSEETDDQDILLTLSDGKYAWTGTVLEEYLRKQSKQVKMAFADFMDETNKALTRKNLGGLNFVYQVKESGDCLTLTWKKHMKSDDIKFQLGSATLKKKRDPSEGITQILEYALEVKECLTKDISELENTNERLSSERTSALKKLDKWVTAKEELETNLYSKFAVVLNDKKAKLRQMKSELESQGQKKEASPSASGGDTDGEIPVNQAKYEEDEETSDEEIKEPVVKRKCSSIGSTDSLLLGDEEPSTSTARRRRRTPTTPKKTPSKPILPKISSGDKSTPGRPTLKKTPSRQSNSDPDADDLLEFF